MSTGEEQYQFIEKTSFRDRLLKDYLRVDKELIIILLLVLITAIIFFFVINQRAFLNFFYLPVLLGAYFYGKRYATLAAIQSVLLILIVAYAYPETFSFFNEDSLLKWLDLGTWGGFLIVVGYCMGLLYEKKEHANREIIRTYQGIVEMLSLIIDSVDQKTQSHAFRVSQTSELLARKMGRTQTEIETIRIAALLHDLGKIGISSEILAKVGKLSADEKAEIRTHTKHAVNMLEPIGDMVLDLLPLILNHHEKYDGSGYNSILGDEIPVGARIIAVADVYDALTSDRPYRKAMTPFQARSEIVTNVGVQFDPDVVRVFQMCFPELESRYHLSAVKQGY